MALGDLNQNVAAGAGTPGYTYTNGVLSSVGGTSTGNTPSLTSSNPTQTSPTPTLTGPTALSGDALNAYLNNSFNNSGQPQTIIDSYNSAVAADTAASQANAKVLTDTGKANISNQNYNAAISTENQQDSQRGGVMNPGAMSVIQNQSNNIVRQLTQQMNDALANNQASLASTNANLIAQENTNMITARQNFLSNYFQTQQEARAQASFQTPEQQQVITLSGQYPNAGITPQDTLAQAEQKITGSAQYKLGQSAIVSGINLQGSQAGLASVQAQQTSIINKFMSGNTVQFKPDIDGLVNGSVTDQTLHAKYDNFPGGAGGAIIASIEAQAQSQGWNPQASKLKADAQSQQNSALNSGNPFTLFGAGVTQSLSAAGSAFTGPGSIYNTFKPNTTGAGVTSSGIKYNITQ